MSFLRTLVTYQATQGKFQIVNNWRYSKHTLVETPKHTLEARAGQRVQTRKVNVIGILKLCSRSLTLRLAREKVLGSQYAKVKFSKFATFIDHFRWPISGSAPGNLCVHYCGLARLYIGKAVKHAIVLWYDWFTKPLDCPIKIVNSGDWFVNTTVELRRWLHYLRLPEDGAKTPKLVVDWLFSIIYLFIVAIMFLFWSH